MLPLILELALAVVSLFASAFVVLWIVIPILPPNPLSRRVSPSEFGLPAFRSLSPADKGHLWMTGIDLIALVVFIWQRVDQARQTPAASHNPISIIRIWLPTTTKSVCVMVLTSLALCHIRTGNSVVFGRYHWMLWAPICVVSFSSTAIAGVASVAQVKALFLGLVAQNSAIAVVTTGALSGIFATLYAIKRNIASLNEDREPWPPKKLVETKSRPSFTAEEIDAIKDGASWITSIQGSRRGSVSAWSFSTQHTTAASSTHAHYQGIGSQTSCSECNLTTPSSWFHPTTNDQDVPPVPSLPPSLRISGRLSNREADPFRRYPLQFSNYTCGRAGSQTSWMTSTGANTTVSAWSYPSTPKGSASSIADTPEYNSIIPRPPTPALATSRVLGGYGYSPNSSENGSRSFPASEDSHVRLSVWSIAGWCIYVWAPVVFSFPYLITLARQRAAPPAVSIFYALSVTLSSPLLALSILLKSPFPIPSGLFERDSSINRSCKRLSSTPSGLPAPYTWSNGSRRSVSSSPTVVEGRRSGDVWVANGDAVRSKSKLGRAMSMLSPLPKLSVVSPKETALESPPLPPIPIPDEESWHAIARVPRHSVSDLGAQFGRLDRRSGRISATMDEGDLTRIMVAQRHYSTLAQTMVVVPGSNSDKGECAVGSATGAAVHKSIGAAHLRTRSISTSTGPQTPTSSTFNDVSTPPPFPLPPTPPSVQAARLASKSHRKWYSSSQSFGPVDETNEIDSLTAGVLPNLIPGLLIGPEMKVTDGAYSPPGTLGRNKSVDIPEEFGMSFSSPDAHPTPTLVPKHGAKSGSRSHRRSNLSLSSLGLNRGNLQTFAGRTSEVRNAFQQRMSQYMTPPSQVIINQHLDEPSGKPNSAPAKLDESDETIRRLGTSRSKRARGMPPDVPVSPTNSARNSTVFAGPSSSSITLFEDFEAELEADRDTHHSTPQCIASTKPLHKPAHSKRRPSIAYIRSDENDSRSNQVSKTGARNQSSNPSTTDGMINPITPDSNLTRLRVKPSHEGKGKGLRQLTLLQGRDTNGVLPAGGHKRTVYSSVLEQSGDQATSRSSLKLGTNPPQFTNQVDASTQPRKGIKPLNLSRSETIKQRAVLRKNEVLPAVVVSPPSLTDHIPYAYAFSCD